MSDDPPGAMGWLRDLLVLLGAFAVGAGVGALLGAANLGTALTFGQIAFCAALVAVLVRGR